MAAPKGNQFWRQRTKHGRDKLFESPDVLWEACTEYFDFVEDNPIMSAKPFSYEGHAWNHNVPMMRAMTIDGLCIFLDISYETWTQYRKDKDFSDVITRAEQIIREQKFTGAAAGLLNANIISRDLGLKDQSTSDLSIHWHEEHTTDPDE
jgi:hypothetical protein